MHSYLRGRVLRGRETCIAYQARGHGAPFVLLCALRICISAQAVQTILFLCSHLRRADAMVLCYWWPSTNQ